MKRGELYWVRLDPVEGSEMCKTRPCVIVSRNELNEVLPVVVVCPLSSTIRPKWRTRLQVRCEGRMADICAEQIRTISKARLGKRLGSLTKSQITTFGKILTDTYGAD